MATIAYAAQRLRQLRRTLAKKLSRRFLQWRLFSRGEADRLIAERQLRGREQYNTLMAADFVVVSFGKSGRTWLRMMLSQVFRLRFGGLPDNVILSFDNFHSINPAVPRMFFTHDNYIKDYTGEPDSKKPFYDKKVILLARDPRDVSVSNYFQWKFRMKPNKKKINNYPPAESDIGIYEYLTSQYGGSLADIIHFMNIWATESKKVVDFHLVRYEDLRRDPKATLRRLLDFMAVPASNEDVAAAVEFSSYENMKKMEQKNTMWMSGGRMAARDVDNPDSYKVRRAKVGGYRDYLDDEQVKNIDGIIAASLDGMYGYAESTQKT